MIRARFFVAGDPAPQGSKRIVQPKGHRRPLLLEMSKKLPAWRKAVAAEALAERQRLGATITVPVTLTLDFWLKRPQRPKNPYPSVDLDKLCRACCDGLVAGQLLADDRLVVHLNAYKGWADEGGCSVEIQDAP